MPLQHISDNMLQEACGAELPNKNHWFAVGNRGGDKVPGIALGTTLITGYPGETAKGPRGVGWRKRVLKGWTFYVVRAWRKTHALHWKDDVVKNETRRCRHNPPWKYHTSSISKNRNALQGAVWPERGADDYFIIFTEFDSPDGQWGVASRKTERRFYVRVGDFAKVKITSATDFDLYGELG